MNMKMVYGFTVGPPERMMWKVFFVYRLRFENNLYPGTATDCFP